MAKGGCCGSKEEDTCCEALNVVVAVLAVVLAAVAAVASALSGHHLTAEGLDGLGVAEQQLQALLQGVVLSQVPVLLLDLVAAAAVWLSFFHCGILNTRCVHCLTTSGMLCFLRVLVCLTFLLELIASQVVVVWRCVLSATSFLCGTNAGLVNQAQAIVQSAKSTLPSGGNSTLGFAGLFANLDLPSYCQASRGELEESSTRILALACLLAVVSQALLAGALNGEKERVGVHEEHERGLLGALSREASDLASHSSLLRAAGEELHGFVAEPDMLHAASGWVSSKVASAAAGAQGASYGQRFGEALGGSKGGEMGREIGQALGGSLGRAAGYEAGLHPSSAVSAAQLAFRGHSLAEEASQELRHFAADGHF